VDGGAARRDRGRDTRYYAENQTDEMFKGMERQSNDFLKIKGRRSSESTEPSAANGAG
jgi:hypothetical protein